MAEVNYTPGGVPMDGLVPNLTWAQLQSYMTGKASGMPTIGGGEGNSAGDGGTYASTSYGTVPGIGGIGQEVGGDPNEYDQDLANGTKNIFRQGPNGEVYSQNQTLNNDSWWDKAGLPILATLAVGGGLGAAGAFSGAAGAAGAAGTTAGSLTGEGALASSAAYDAGLAGVGANAGADVAGGFTGFGAGVGGDLTGIGMGTGTFGADTGALASSSLQGTAADWLGLNGVSQAADPAWYQPLLDTAQANGFGNGPIGSIQNVINGTGQIGDYASVGSNLNTAGSLADKLSIGDAGTDITSSTPTTSIPGVSQTNSGLGGPSGNGLSYSDAANSAATGTDYSGGVSDTDAYLSRLANNPLSTLGSSLVDGNSWLKSNLGINGLQLGAGLLDGYNKLQSNNNAINTRNTLSNMFSSDGSYAKELQQTLERRDAAAGRQSQYGPRQVELEAKLAALQSGVLNSSNFSNLNNTTALGGVFNSLYGSYNQNQAVDTGAAALTNLLTKYFGSGGGT